MLLAFFIKCAIATLDSGTTSRQNERGAEFWNFTEVQTVDQPVLGQNCSVMDQQPENLCNAKNKECHQPTNYSVYSHTVINEMSDGGCSTSTRVCLRDLMLRATKLNVITIVTQSKVSENGKQETDKQLTTRHDIAYMHECLSRSATIAKLSGRQDTFELLLPSDVKLDIVACSLLHQACITFSNAWVRYKNTVGKEKCKVYLVADVPAFLAKIAKHDLLLAYNDIMREIEQIRKHKCRKLHKTRLNSQEYLIGTCITQMAFWNQYKRACYSTEELITLTSNELLQKATRKDTARATIIQKCIDDDCYYRCINTRNDTVEQFYLRTCLYRLWFTAKTVQPSYDICEFRVYLQAIVCRTHSRCSVEKFTTLYSTLYHGEKEQEYIRKVCILYSTWLKAVNNKLVLYKLLLCMEVCISSLYGVDEKDFLVNHILSISDIQEESIYLYIIKQNIIATDILADPSAILIDKE